MPYGSTLAVSTEVIGFRRVIARRRSEFRPTGEHRPLASAITDWVLLNADGRPDLVLSLGGDGTMLRAAQIAHKSDALLVGVEGGRLGRGGGPHEVVRRRNGQLTSPSDLFHGESARGPTHRFEHAQCA